MMPEARAGAYAGCLCRDKSDCCVAGTACLPWIQGSHPLLVSAPVLDGPAVVLRNVK